MFQPQFVLRDLPWTWNNPDGRESLQFLKRQETSLLSCQAFILSNDSLPGTDLMFKTHHLLVLFSNSCKVDGAYHIIWMKRSSAPGDLRAWVQGPLPMSCILKARPNTPQEAGLWTNPHCHFLCSNPCSSAPASSCTQADFAKCSIPRGFVTLGVTAFNVEM